MNETSLSEPAEALVRRWYASLDFSLLSDQIDWQIAEGFPVGGRWVGRTAVSSDFFPRLRAMFAPWKVLPEEFIASGDRVVALGHYEGAFKDRGKPFRLSFVHVFEVHHGSIVTVRQWTDTATLAGFA